MEGDRLNTTLVISDVKESDFAQFTVVVRNQHGSDAYAVSVTSGEIGHLIHLKISCPSHKANKLFISKLCSNKKGKKNSRNKI